jgi:glutamine amidotransferase
MRITVLDYGSGNLHSLVKALAAPSHTVRIEPDPRQALDTDLLVLPGVGAFSSAAECLAGARQAVREALESGLPCIGICLGMQLLLETSEEGEGRGLGLIAGRVERLRAPRVPHIGWSTVEPAGAPDAGGRAPATDPALVQTPLPLAYFAHSFVCRPASVAAVTAWSRHQDDCFPAVVRRARTVGVQFHPEKSSRDGIRFLAGLVAEASSATATRPAWDAP